MNATMRFAVTGSLLAILAGCSGASPDSGESNSPTASAAVNAAELLSNTLAEATEADKRVFVHIGAPW